MNSELRNVWEKAVVTYLIAHWRTYRTKGNYKPNFNGGTQVKIRTWDLWNTKPESNFQNHLQTKFHNPWSQNLYFNTTIYNQLQNINSFLVSVQRRPHAVAQK